jgi:hypothetical protein
MQVAQDLLAMGDYSSPKIGDVPQRKKLSTTIGANNYAYLHKMVKRDRAESVGEAVDKAVEMARRLDNRATLERQTSAYFKGLTSEAAAEETDLEEALTAHLKRWTLTNHNVSPRRGEIWTAMLGNPRSSLGPHRVARLP